MIAAIILTAGLSSRTKGSNKLLLNYKGKKIWIYLAKIAILYAYYSYIKNALFLYENSNLIL